MLPTRTGVHTLCEPVLSKCTSESLQVKSRRPNPQRGLCASLRSRNAHGHLTRAISCRNLQVNGRRPRASKTCGAHVVRACAIKMHMDLSQEPSYVEICRKNAAPQSEHLDQTPASTLTVRTLQYGHAVGGKMPLTLLGFNRPHMEDCRDIAVSYH